MKYQHHLSFYTIAIALLLLTSGCSELPSLAKTGTDSTPMESTSLTQAISSSLGVGSKQAESGAGALLSVASTAMTATDFSRITNVIPDSGTLLNAGSFGDMNALFEAGKLMDGYNQLSNVFTGLGLNSSMIGQFASVIFEYLNVNGGSSTSGLFQSALSSKLSGVAGSLLGF